MGRTSAAGGFQLLIGVVASNVIMAVGTIVLARLLSPAEYGLYSVALIPSLMINLFRDWGVNSAITKYVAHSKASENEESVRRVVAAGLTFEILTGLVLSLLMVLLADFLGSTILHRPEISPLLSIVSITIFSGSLLTAAQSSFIGLERMGLNSLTLIISAIVKTVLSPLLVILGFGVLGPVLGYTLSFLVTGLLGLTMIYFLLFRNLKRTRNNRTELRNTLRIMLRYGVPLSIASILTGLLGQFYSFMMAIYVGDVMIGNLHVAANFAVLLTFLTIPISTVLFPAFSKLDSQNDQHLLRTIFMSSVKYTAMLLIPATAAVMVLSKPMINTLFGEQWIYAPLFLTLYVLSNVTYGIGSLSVAGLLRGLGETRMQMTLDFLTTMIGIPIAFLLIPSLGMVGVIIGPIIAAVPSTFLGLRWVWRRYKATSDWGSLAKIFTASTLAGGLTYLPLNFLELAAPLKLVFGGALFLSLYVIIASFVGAITKSDIGNLRSILSDLGFLTAITSPPLKVVEKVVGRIRPLSKNKDDR